MRTGNTELLADDGSDASIRAMAGCSLNGLQHYGEKVGVEEGA